MKLREVLEVLGSLVPDLFPGVPERRPTEMMGDPFAPVVPGLARDAPLAAEEHLLVGQVDVPVEDSQHLIGEGEASFAPSNARKGMSAAIWRYSRSMLSSKAVLA